MQSTLIQEYYLKTQQYRRRSDDTGLIQFLQEQQEVMGLIPRYAKLIEGELAYHQKKYALAVKHYLSMEEVEDQQFFCYRASAFLCYEKKQYRKAFTFAKRTLKIEPKDVDTLHLLYRLLDVLERDHHEPTFVQKEEVDEDFNYVSVAEKELEELTNIF